LEERFKLERELSSMTVIPYLLQQLPECIRREDWKSALILVNKTLMRIRPLSVSELFRIIQRVDTTAEKVKNKDIVLFLGGTGSGKSTLIHFFAGSEMEWQKVKGLKHIVPTKITNSDAKNITTSPFSVSETRYIIPVTINFADIGSYRKNSIILCDSPGFGDTRSPEIDIGNAIATVKVIRECKSVLPVILISYQSIGDRSEGLKNLAYTLIGLVRNIADTIESFSYIFTKFPNDEKDNIHAKLKNMLDTVNEQEESDTSFMTVLRDLLRKTDDGALCIDPIKDNPGKILDKLLNNNPINHPDEIFQFSTTTNSKTILCEQISTYQRSIKYALERSEYDLIKYRLDQLKRLNDELDQKYVDAYKECIYCINQHLEKEYEIAIAFLDDCLFEQTILNEKDIDKYKVYIDRANLAENLRNDHLNEQLIHSSAFNQHIERQVIRMCTDLENKSIDDELAKIYLDKIKLLCKYFSTISDKYRGACQVLSDKIDHVVQTFEIRTSSHQFDQSATMINQLFNAFSVIQGHLDCSNLESKYVNCKKYFLNCLNELVQNLNYIFTQERLEIIQIDHLKNSMSLFELALQTHLLHQHISKEEIEKIYEELSSKIQTYFNQIVKTIEIQFENRNALDTIESSMNQMDSLRSMISIAHRTNLAYHNIIRKLINYVYLIKQDVDELLRIFFQHETKRNHERLRKVLSDLQNAHWIKKYWREFHDTIINNLVEKMTQHVSKMKQSFKNITLDLDNVDKIEGITTIITDIHQIKIVPSLISMIDEVDLWFSKAIKHGFDEILSLATKKHEGNKSFDIKKVQKALTYLDTCHNISLISENECRTTRTILEKLISNHSENIDRIMNVTFHKIKTNDGDISQQVRYLSKRLREIIEIKNTYSRAFSCFHQQTIDKDWKDCLINFQQTLNDEMMNLVATHDTHHLQMRLFLAQKMSELDWYLDKETFLEIYSKYRELVEVQNTNLSRQIQESLKNFDYETAAIKIRELQLSGEIGKEMYIDSKRFINHHLEQIYKETKKQVVKLQDEIEIELIESVVENLELMERAKQFLEMHLSNPNRIENSIEEIEKQVEERIQSSLDCTNHLLVNHYLYETSQKLESIKLIQRVLGKFCTNEISNRIVLLEERYNKEILENIINKYSTMDLSEYRLNPPIDFFDKKDRTSQIYIEAMNKMKEIILGTFRRELEQAKEKRLLWSENPHRERVESTMEYLPEIIKKSLGDEIELCKKYLVKCDKDDQKELETIFNSGNLKQMREKIVEYKQFQYKEKLMRKGLNIIRKQVQEIIHKLHENIQKYANGEVLNQMNKLYHYKVQFRDFTHEVDQLYLNEQVALEKIVEDQYKYFINYLSNLHLSIQNQENIEKAQKTFRYLLNCLEFLDNLPASTTMFTDDFIRKFKQLIEKIKEYSDKHKIKCNEALKTPDINQLLNILKMTSAWNSLFSKIKSDYNINRKQNTYIDCIITSLEKLKSPLEMLTLISQRIVDLGNELINQELLNTATKELDRSRYEFYRNLHEKFLILSRAKVFNQFSREIDINKIEQTCLVSFEKKVRTIQSDVELFLNEFSQNSTLVNINYNSFNLCYSNIIAIKKEMKIMGKEVESTIESIESTIFDRIRRLESLIEKEKSMLIVADNLKSIKLIGTNIPLLKAKINEKIDEILNNYKVQHNSLVFVQLGKIFNGDSHGIGQRIISEHTLFQGYVLNLFNEKTQTYRVEYVLSKIRGDEIEKTLLKKRYDEFRNIYDTLIHDYLRSNINLVPLISDIKITAGDLVQIKNNIKWTANIRDKALKLLARVFALWTLQNAKYYFEVEGLNDTQHYLFQPHAAQVIAIFRMLSIGDKKEELMSNLAEIGTGEGKSIVLGVTACVLSLLGFDVCCASYSEYLSQRDHSTLRSLFDSLDLMNNIHYNTFNKLCEYIINENCNIRQIVGQLICEGSQLSTMRKQGKNTRAKILLIDEVDVFFSREFYGNIYTPSISLQDPTITYLVNHIWTQRKSKLTLSQIKQTDEYRACCNRYSDWQLLINEAIKDMLVDVQSFQSHDYIVKSDRIAYKEQDNIVYNAIYRYKTLFAYYYEHEKGNITKESLHANVNIRINCGSFSYTEIPLEFQYIIGVTGTLETLSDAEKNVIQNNYKIMKYTYIPSVFGENNLRFQPEDDIMIENNENYFNQIRTEINRRLIGMQLEKRAVLVFFESKEKLLEFYKCDALASIKDSVLYLIEEASFEEKEHIIQRATSSGQVTLFTRMFGRGTDFICHEKSVTMSGGTHVIQTFLSEEVSEEKQIKGRTARQGEQGSYSMILLDQDLEKFHITIDDISNMRKTLYDLLHDKRTRLFHSHNEQNRKYGELAKEKHQRSQKFLLSLRAKELTFIRRFLIETNKGTEMSTSLSRTICLMDATGSMTNLLQKCKNTVQVMYERAMSILIEHQIDPDCFQMQFVIYRNYNSPVDKILQYSSWETKAENLRKFMSTIESEKGWENEAIEIGLWHANQENEKERISQVILIGDAPPNSRKEIQEKRKYFGEIYWLDTNFAQVRGYTDELEKLISNQIPVHAYYVTRKAQEEFEKIAKCTGGQCQMLDINSSAGSDMLTDLVTESILNNVGGNSRGNLLVEAYRNKFGKSYSRDLNS